MNPTEAAQVLAKAAAYDNRQATQAAALAWAEALDTDMPLAEALRIVGEHYRDERAWVMPADINRRWRTLGKARLETAVRMGLPEPPDELADDPEAWAAWKKAQISAVKAGCDGKQVEARAWHAIDRTPPRTPRSALRTAARRVAGHAQRSNTPTRPQDGPLTGEQPPGSTHTHPRV